jgi:hypothetical protein
MTSAAITPGTATAARVRDVDGRSDGVADGIRTRDIRDHNAVL